jgi:hypothetical protein
MQVHFARIYLNILVYSDALKQETGAQLDPRLLDDHHLYIVPAPIALTFALLNA